MERDLSLDLHLLTARLDRAADRILRAELGVPYRRFLALFLVGELDATTQRALAKGLGVTEPSVSRMTGTLVDAGLLDAQPDPAGGNRRRLGLTPDGEALVSRCRELLGGRLKKLVEQSDVPYNDYAHHTRQLLSTVEIGEQSSATSLRKPASERMVPTTRPRRLT